MKSNKLGAGILDWVFIILNVSSSLSLAGTLLFDRIPVPAFISQFALSLFIYLLRWKPSFPFLFRVSRSFLLSVFFLIYFTDIVQNLFFNSAFALARIVVFFNIVLFLNYLYNMFMHTGEEGGFIAISRPYSAYCVYNVAIVVVSGALIFTGLLNPESNQINRNSLMADNLEGGQTVYWPGYLSVAIANSRLLGAWGIPVTLTGLSHEPHVLNFLILPSLFFVRAYRKYDKWYWPLAALYVVSMFMSFSTTALGAFIAVVAIDLFWRIFIKRKRASILVLILSVFALIWINGRIGLSALIQDEIVRKTVNQTGSLEYSGAMLRYIVTPSSIFGTGNLPSIKAGLSSSDVGLVSSVLDVLFYAALLASALKLVFSKDETRHFIGTGCTYMLIHMLKVNLLAFNYCYLAFIVFILYMLNERNGTGKFEQECPLYRRV